MRRTLIIISIAGLVLFVAAFMTGQRYARGLSERAKQRVVGALQDRFDADVQLKSLTLSLVPKPSVSGEGLYIRHRGWPADHPLIGIEYFSASATFWDLLYERDRVDVLVLKGLQIHIPPKGKAIEATTEQDNHEVASATPGQDTTRLRIRIKQIIADDSLLEIDAKQPGKNPLRFPIERLTLWSVGPSKPFAFKGRLRNAKPPGGIDTEGRFGPWQRDDPRSTALSGTYRFRNADLSVFKGISGTLSSDGTYTGVLQHIDVVGTTNTPDFALKRGGAPVHLRTNFHSIVNGTDGETLLEPVDASFLHSRFICTGGIVKENGQTGKTVDLNAVARQSRIEDILLLVTGEKQPFITGTVDFRSKIIIPPGPEDVVDKLKLQGEFKLLSAQFTSPKVEQRLLTLSDRARGITKAQQEDQPPQTVASNLISDFNLHDGIAQFSRLQFEVPGAQIRLAGDYHLQTQRMDFKGVFRMKATLAETQSGVKRLLLRPLDPFFEKNGAGFEVPLQIGGDRQNPELSISVFHHTFKLR